MIKAGAAEAIMNEKQVEESPGSGKSDFGVQPLDEVMTRLGLSNHDLVSASTRQLTHKMVQKGRKGKQLTLNAQQKILSAVLNARPGMKVALQDLFNY